MRREELAHLLRSASRIADDRDIVVIGSQSILGSWDEDDLPDQAVASIEADLTFWDDPGNMKSDAIDGVLGEDSPFHGMYGYYAQGVDLSTATLPAGWRERVVVWSSNSSQPARGHCLDPHDLAVAKLVAQREKDFIFVAALLDAGLLEAHLLHQRAGQLETGEGVRRRTRRWIEAYTSRRQPGGRGGAAPGRL